LNGFPLFRAKPVANCEILPCTQWLKPIDATINTSDHLSFTIETLARRNFLPSTQKFSPAFPHRQLSFEFSEIDLAAAITQCLH
jgi:hypothetical protein